MGHDEGMPSSGPTPVRHLWLLRHGKAASDAPWGGGDRERPLTGRGRRDAAALGRRLATEDPPLGIDGLVTPRVVLCSSAVRTRQTADLLVAELGEGVAFDAVDALYEAPTETVLRYVREVDEVAAAALVVGHNPSMFRLALELLDPDAPGDRDRLEAHGFPTCALAVLALRVDSWEDAVQGCGRLVGLLAPPY